MKRAVLIVFGIFLLVAIAKPASAEPLRPGDVLRITFSPPSMPYPGYVPDLLQLDMGGTLVEPFVSRSATLFDGDTVLGTYTTTFQGFDTGDRTNVFSSWRSSTSLYRFLDPTVVPFGSIVNRTIDGIILFRIASGLFDVDLQDLHLLLVRADGETDWTASVFAQPTITSAEINPVPEPGTWLLLATGAGMIARRRRGAVTTR